MEERLIHLETKISYQESLIADLNDTVVDQQKEIGLLKTMMELLRARLDELQEHAGESMPHVRPPHY